MQSRSREGAWIEIIRRRQALKGVIRRSREGAWIEMVRGLFGAAKAAVAPARERGLKLLRLCLIMVLALGRSREGAWIEMIPAPMSLAM